jgi:uncharacterized protein (DUF952 family)
MIYHLVVPTCWQQSPPGPYRAESLATEGFIHCSNEEQVAGVANAFYADQPELLVLCIVVERLTAPVRDEDPGVGERFPHVYGPIERDAIVEVRRLERSQTGGWLFPGGG